MGRVIGKSYWCKCFLSLKIEFKETILQIKKVGLRSVLKLCKPLRHHFHISGSTQDYDTKHTYILYFLKNFSGSKGLH